MDLIRRKVSLMCSKFTLEYFEEMKAEEGETLIEISVLQKSDGVIQRQKPQGLYEGFFSRFLSV